MPDSLSGLMPESFSGLLPNSLSGRTPDSLSGRSPTREPALCGWSVRETTRERTSAHLAGDPGAEASELEDFLGGGYWRT